VSTTSERDRSDYVAPETRASREYSTATTRSVFAATIGSSE